MNDVIKVLSGSAHPALSQQIVDHLGIPLCRDQFGNILPDGETSVQIKENIRGTDVFIVQPTCPPANQNLMELLIMVDAVRRASAQRITAVLLLRLCPSQDRKVMKPRVPITGETGGGICSSRQG